MVFICHINIWIKVWCLLHSLLVCFSSNKNALTFPISLLWPGMITSVWAEIIRRKEVGFKSERLSSYFCRRIHMILSGSSEPMWIGLTPVRLDFPLWSVYHIFSDPFIHVPVQLVSQRGHTGDMEIGQGLKKNTLASNLYLNTIKVHRPLSCKSVTVVIFMQSE